MFMLNGDSEKIQALVDVLKSDEIKDFINELEREFFCRN